MVTVPNLSSGVRHLTHVLARVRLIMEDRSRPFFRRPAISDPQRGNILRNDLDPDAGNGPTHEDSPGERRPMSQRDLDTVEEPGLPLECAWREVEPTLALMDPPLAKNVDQTASTGDFHRQS